MKKIYNSFINYFVDIIFILVIIFYFMNCTFYSQENPNYNCYFLIFIILSIYYSIYTISNKLLNNNEKKLKLFIFFGSILIYTFWNFIARTEPVSDYAVLINGAQELLKGNFSKLTFDPTNYFYFYNFQVGYTLYLSLIMKLFGTRIIFLKIIEILILSFSNLLVYLITSKIYSKKIGMISSIIYITLLFNIAGSSVINNQHISTLFVLLSVYILIKNDKKSSKVLSGILLAISYILRQSSIIFLIAYICIYIWKLFKNYFKDYKIQLLNVLLLIVSFFSFTKIYDFSLKELKVVPNSALDGNAKYFKFILGIQYLGITGSETTDALKTQVYYDLEKYNFDYKKYNNDSKKYLINKYKNNLSDIIYFNMNEKLYKFIGAPDNQINYANTLGISNFILNIINYYGYAQYILLILLSFISSIIIFKNKKKTNDEYIILFKIIFIGFFLVHIFIEAQTRYRYDQYLMLSIIAAPALERIICLIESQKSKFKKIK